MVVLFGRSLRLLSVLALVGLAVLLCGDSTVQMASLRGQGASFRTGLVKNGSNPSLFSRRDKAAFADPQVVAFVRPGLRVTIQGATIAQDGTVTVNFSIADPKGLALDRQGITTPGAVTTSFLIAYLPNDQNQYVNYITRTATSTTSTGITTQQPTADSGGAYTPTPTGYMYTFKNKLPAGFDVTATHTIGVYATRDLSDFDLGTYWDDDVFSLVPNGSPVTHIHDEVRTQTCNKCHDPLSAHGGPRRSVPLCVMCHQPQLVDPDTGNVLDMKVFIHKIHMGEDLPSVKAGHPYQIIGFQNAVNDYSTVVFPANVMNCTFCHEGSLAPPPNSGQPQQGGQGAPAAALATKYGVPPENGGDTTGTGTALLNPKGAACGSVGNPGCDPDLLPWPPTQKDRWLNTPTRVTCGACHDNVNFATGENHANLPQPTDNECTTCHFIQGETPFDLSILGAHTIPQFAPGLPGVVFKLDKVDNGLAGQSPTVTFEIHDKSGNPLNASDMNLLNLVMAGPTGDYTNAISESATKASGSGGTYTYTFTAAVPAGATGTYTIGIEGYKSITLLPGTQKQQVVRDVGFNQVIDFSVDGSPVTAHTQDNTQAQCNECHFALSLHGTIRQNVHYCILCHNPTADDSSQRPASAAPAQSINLPVLVHRLHTGDTAEAGGQMTPFVIYGFNHSVNDFSDVRYPAALTHCEKCHVNETDELPVPDSRIAVNNPRDFINPTPPMTAACTACHTAKDASAHASVNTSPTLGESCGVCHGPDAEFAVDKVHTDTQ